MFTTLLTIASLPLLAIAQASSPSQITVQVAPGGAFVFSPPNITATVGTLVNFVFPSGAIEHSVTQSTFADPCTPLTGSSGTGFDSGLTIGKQFTLNVTDASTPIWFFCKAPEHCGAGMVGSINAPTSGNTYNAFLSAAKAIGASEANVPDNGPVTGGVGAIATAAPSVASSSSTSSTSTSGSGSSTGSGSGSSTGSGPSPSTTGSGSSSGAARLVVSGGLGFVAAIAAFALAA